MVAAFFAISVLHVDRDQPVGPAVDGQRNLLGCELAADLAFNSGERRKGDRTAPQQRAELASAQVAVRAHAGTERQAGNRRAGEIMKSGGYCCYVSVTTHAISVLRCGVTGRKLMPGCRTDRRAFVILLGCSMIAKPTAGLGQEAGKVKRIGFLRVGSPPAAFIDGFRQGLRELGLVEGQHYVIEFGLAPTSAQMPAAAAELVRRGVNIIVASGTPSVLPARDAAGQIPVVFVATLDPVATELVTSLARPGRNITGMTSISGDLIAKRLELIREVIPK